MRSSRGLLITAAAAAGVAAGWLLSRRYLEQHKAALFSTAPRRRHAALGYLAGRPSPETLRLLRDYLVWERHGGLKRRGIRVLRQLESALS